MLFQRKRKVCKNLFGNLVKDSEKSKPHLQIHLILLDVDLGDLLVILRRLANDDLLLCTILLNMFFSGRIDELRVDY